MNQTQQTVDKLLVAFREEAKTSTPKKIIFHGVEGYDVYNPTAPFQWNDQTLMIGRVEKRDSEHSKAIFFQEKAGEFYRLEGMPEYQLQDPYVSFIGGKIVFGGTEIYPHPDDATKLAWRAKFYYGEDLLAMEELVTGPRGMKDIRLIELANGTVGVFSRPQGERGGRGKIGFTVINKLTDLTAEIIDQAPLLDQFIDEEWGGCNEATLLSNGKIGVLGHIAKFSEGDVRHYYPMTFCLDAETGEYSEMKIIAERCNMLPGPSKRPDLEDVLFSAGLVRVENGKAILYTGVSDAETQSIEIPDPFSEYEIYF
ncbi:Protein of unknown function [Amphibacillus marinus]|uniref:DUF1861 family protein n=1 Tax=Amphibacillus marinus TaxID=872970 RepID=A0A1H8QD32_9BACI|nr:DUF1861 family protein [Amphibacillus marinus]SEO51956.1 Protein of unknown function [Amphibacillus marinus]